MCVFSEVCIDEEKGFDVEPNETLKPKKLGRWVLTTQECQEILKMREKFIIDNPLINTGEKK